MTPPIEPHDRLTEIKSIHRDYHNFYQLLRGVVLVAVLAGIGVLIFSSDLPSYWQNIYVTIVGAIGTVFIIDQRAEQRAIRQRKEELILQMRSQNNDYAIEAARLLWLRGWIADGTLTKADLTLANLKAVGLVGANLSGAILSGANLEDATLWDANFQYVLWGSANLKKARLSGANLEGSRFDNAKLQGAILSGANLMNAKFLRTTFDEETILPDNSYWKPDIDPNLTRFTDPNHPQFWRSTDPSSPAYRPPPKPSI